MNQLQLITNEEQPEIAKCKNSIIQNLENKFSESIKEFNLKKNEILQSKQVAQKLEDNIIPKAQNCLNLIEYNQKMFSFLEQNLEQYYAEQFQTNAKVLDELNLNQQNLINIYKSSQIEQKPNVDGLAQLAEVPQQVYQQDEEDDLEKSGHTIVQQKSEKKIEVVIPVEESEEKSNCNFNDADFIF